MAFTGKFKECAFSEKKQIKLYNEVKGYSSKKAIFKNCATDI